MELLRLEQLELVFTDVNMNKKFITFSNFINLASEIVQTSTNTENRQKIEIELEFDNCNYKIDNVGKEEIIKEMQELIEWYKLESVMKEKALRECELREMHLKLKLIKAKSSHDDKCASRIKKMEKEIQEKRAELNQWCKDNILV